MAAIEQQIEVTVAVDIEAPDGLQLASAIDVEILPRIAQGARAEGRTGVDPGFARFRRAPHGREDQIQKKERRAARIHSQLPSEVFGIVLFNYEDAKMPRNTEVRLSCYSSASDG